MLTIAVVILAVMALARSLELTRSGFGSACRSTIRVPAPQQVEPARQRPQRGRGAS